MLELPAMVILVAASLVAGFVDAIAGGGGLITLPTLLAVGIPPHLALGTNKGQSVFGALAAMVRYARSGLVDWRLAVATFPPALLGSIGGALLVLAIRPNALRPVIVVLLVAVVVFVALRRPADVAPVERLPPSKAIAAAIALVIGTYDGFFGPGTGTFLIVAFVALLGMTLGRATAEAKVVNFASNLGALVWFAAQGKVLFAVALPMAAAQLVGGYLGAHAAVKGGDKIVRRVVLLVVAALIVKLLRDLFS